MRPPRVAFVFLLLSAAAAAQEYVISTFAGGGTPATSSVALAAAIGFPLGIATDTAGNVYFGSSDLNAVFKLTPNGALTRIAGGSGPGYSGDGGPATSAQLRIGGLGGVAVDRAGNVFIADTWNGCIRKVFPDGIIATVAGTGKWGYSGDGGPATSAQLNLPAGVAVDTAGNLFIADHWAVRKVSVNGMITTVAGNGPVTGSAADGGPATNATVVPLGIAVDTAGNLFIADQYSWRIRKVDANGIITTVAGNGVAGSSGDGGPATRAQVYASGVAVDGSGNLFLSDGTRIRHVSASGIITALAGGLTPGFTGDGGPATAARLSGAYGLTVDSTGNVFVTDGANGRIRRVSPNGIITTVAGSGAVGPSVVPTGDGGTAKRAYLRYPSSVAADRLGNVFITDSADHRIRRVSPDGTITTLAGTGAPGTSGDGGPAVDARLQWPAALILDAAGNLFFSDAGSTVRRISAEGTITTVARGLSNQIRALAVDPSGNLLIAEYDRIRKVSLDGTVTTVAGGGSDRGDGGPATNAQLYPSALLIDGAGNVLIADAATARIRKVSPDGAITTVAGGAVFPAPLGDGGPATAARLSGPAGLALDRDGNLFISDPGLDFLTGGETGPDPSSDYRIRKVSPDGRITTVAGIGTPGLSGDGGPASAGALSGPLGVAVDGAGNVYIADSTNGAVRVLRPTERSLLIGAVVDVANPREGRISPGKIVVIYGAGLGPAQLIENRPTNGALGVELSGTSVTFNGIAAPILHTSATQVAAVVPYAITGTSVRVVVTYRGQVSNELTVAAAAAAPSLFTVNPQGSGQAVAINAADGSVNSAANPVASGGSISLFATGEGQTAPAGVDGRLGGSTPARSLLPVTATVGGVTARVQYAGGIQGQVAGLLQVNVLIPGGIQTGGYVPVVLTSRRTKQQSRCVDRGVA